MRPLLALLIALPLGAAEPAATIDRFLLAHRLRTEQAQELAAHTAERQRLEALVAATHAVTARTQQEAAQAEERLAAVTRRQATTPDIAALEQVLAAAVAGLESGVVEATRHLPPAAPAGAAVTTRIDAAILRLEAAERAATTVAVSVVTGRLADGTTQAVKVLRVGGTARWWVALDGRRAGLVHPAADGSLGLQPEEGTTSTIAAALAQAEGREAPGLVVLPSGVQP